MDSQQRSYSVCTTKRNQGVKERYPDTNSHSFAQLPYLKQFQAWNLLNEDNNQLSERGGDCNTMVSFPGPSPKTPSDIQSADSAPGEEEYFTFQGLLDTGSESMLLPRHTKHRCGTPTRVEHMRTK